MGDLGWIDTDTYSFDCMLRMERFQIRWILENPNPVAKEALAVALKANPKVAWYFTQKCPDSALG